MFRPAVPDFVTSTREEGRELDDRLANAPRSPQTASDVGGALPAESGEHSCARQFRGVDARSGREIEKVSSRPAVLAQARHGDHHVRRGARGHGRPSAEATGFKHIPGVRTGFPDNRDKLS